jgi:hypothetical protein
MSNVDLSRVTGIADDGVRFVQQQGGEDRVNDAARAQALGTALALGAISGAALRRAAPAAQFQTRELGGNRDVTGAPPIWPSEPVPTPNRSTPDSGSSWGRSAVVRYTDNSRELARVQLDKSEALTLVIEAVEPPSPGTTGFAGPVPLPVSVWASVTCGNGSTSITREVACADRLDIPLPPSSFVSVSIYLATADGTPARNVAWDTTPGDAQVAVNIARGIRGLGGQASMFSTDYGVNFRLVDSPCRLMSIAAHLGATSGGDLFLQAFDSATTPVGDGAIPVEEWPLGATPAPGLPRERQLSPRGLGAGLCVAVSTTPAILSVAAVEAWVSAEILLL